jgi:ribosomal protein S10
MSLDYDLEMATMLSLEQFAREVVNVAQQLGLVEAAVTPEQIVSDGTTTTLGTWVKVSISFELYKHDKLEEQKDDFVRVVGRLLRRVPGDTVLTGMENYWLVRRGDELDVSEVDCRWPPHRLAELPEPYRRMTHVYG